MNNYIYEMTNDSFQTILKSILLSDSKKIKNTKSIHYDSRKQAVINEINECSGLLGTCVDIRII